MWSTSSRSIGSRFFAFCVLAFFWLLIRSGTCWAQELPVSPPSSDSSKAFLQAVQELRDYLKDKPQDKLLTLILQHYDNEEKVNNSSLSKLSTLRQQDKDQTLRDELSGDILSGLAGFAGGYATAKLAH